MFEEVVDAVVVESDGVEKARWGLDRSRRRVAGPGFRGDRLRNDRTQLREIDQTRHLPSITKRAGCDENWVAQMEGAQLHGEVEAHVCQPTARAARMQRLSGL